MSHLLRHILLLVFLIGRNNVFVKASDYAVECGEDICCITMAKLMAATNEMNNKLEKLDKQAREMNAKLDRQVEDLNAKLEKQATEIELKLDKQAEDLNAKLDKLDKQFTETNAKLDKQSEDLNGKLDKQATVINAKVVRKAEDLNAKLDKQATEMNAKLDKKSENLSAKLDKQATEMRAKLDKQSEDLNAKLDKLDKQTAEMNAKLDKQAEVLNAKLDKQASEMNTKLDRQTTALNAKLDVQAKDMEILKVRSNKTAASTKEISTQLERHSADFLTHDGRLKAHDVAQRNECQLAKSIYGAELGPRDCSDIQLKGYTVSGIYRVYPGSDNKRIEADVFCDFKTPGQSWLVFQRRKDGSVNFERYWKDYERGFGNLNGEFWLGNEILSLLTMNRKYKLRVELEDFDRQKVYAEYSIFSVKPATDKYRLTVAGYSGIAGDSLAWHNGMQFSTKDADNDASRGNCAHEFRGAWWYNNCHSSNLNGVYLRSSHTGPSQGVTWYYWRKQHNTLKTSEMKITAVF